jgi:hypothetical protein
MMKKMTALEAWAAREIAAAQPRPTDNDPVGRHNTEFPTPFTTNTTNRIPQDRLPKPYPCEAPPEPYCTTVTNAVGMRFRALVVPLPMREVGIGGTLPEAISGEHIRHLAMLAVDRAR